MEDIFNDLLKFSFLVICFFLEFAMFPKLKNVSFILSKCFHEYFQKEQMNSMFNFRIESQYVCIHACAHTHTHLFSLRSWQSRRSWLTLMTLTKGQVSRHSPYHLQMFHLISPGICHQIQHYFERKIGFTLQRDEA